MPKTPYMTVDDLCGISLALKYGIDCHPDTPRSVRRFEELLALARQQNHEARDKLKDKRKFKPLRFRLVAEREVSR
jgi:hypothetical protein